MNLAESHCMVEFKGMSSDEVVNECVPIWWFKKKSVDKNTRFALVAFDSTTEYPNFIEIVKQKIFEARDIQEARDINEALAVVDTTALGDDHKPCSNELTAKLNDRKPERKLLIGKLFKNGKFEKRAYNDMQNSSPQLLKDKDLTYQNIILKNGNNNKTTESVTENVPKEDNDMYNLNLDENKNKHKGKLRNKLMKAINENIDECLKTVKKMTRSALSALYKKMVRKIHSSMFDNEKKRRAVSLEALERED